MSIKLYQEINLHKKWCQVKKVSKGWSKDEKYYLEDQEGKSFLLRLSDLSKYKQKKMQFEMLKKVEKLQFNTPKPIEIGTIQDRVYMLLSWVDGDPMEEKIATFDQKTQYTLGVQAGKILKKLHALEIEKQDQTWYQLYEEKLPRKIKKAAEAAILPPHFDIFVHYVETNKHMLIHQPMAFQHGDYHLGNMVVSEQGALGIIDFDKSSIADPIDEFKPFCWNVLRSEAFQTGLIDGYVLDQDKKAFFNLLAIYAAESCIGHVSWAITFGEKEVSTAIKIADLIYQWYQGFETVIPTWYQENLKYEYRETEST